MSQSSENSEKIKAEGREEVGGEGRVAGVVLQERDRKSLGSGEGGGRREEGTRRREERAKVL